MRTAQDCEETPGVLHAVTAARDELMNRISRGSRLRRYFGMCGAWFLSGGWCLCALSLALVCVVLGIFGRPDQWGREDWDYFAHHYEAIRRSVLEYRQIPWWDPWNSGGLPLAANPQVGLVSINTALVLAFGTYPGLKLALLVHLVLAAHGAWYLAGSCLRDPVARGVVAFVYAANGSVALYYAAGHLGVQLAAWFPWALALAFRLEQDSRWGLALGAVVALAILTSMQYLALYLLLVLFAIGIWRIVAVRSRVSSGQGHGKCHASQHGAQPDPGNARRQLVLGWLITGSSLLALAGLRLGLSGKLILEFPRSRFSRIHQDTPLGVVLVSLAMPGQGMDFEPPAWTGWRGTGWHEYGCYVGMLSSVLFLVSLKNGWRWWHSLALVCLWLALGNSRWFHSSWWLADLPIFSTMRVATRWRVVAVLGIALGCGAVLDEWRSSRRRLVWLAGTTAAACIVLDLGINAYKIYKEAFVVAQRFVDREDSHNPFVHLHSPPALQKTNSAIFPTLLANYGVVYGYEPLIGQTGRPKSARVWVGHPEYRGEHWSEAGPVDVLHWSPNTVALRVEPAAEVLVNQNPGSYWLVNGERVSAPLRSVDRHEPFVVRADASGRVDLRVWPTGWIWGLTLTAVGAVGTPLLLMLSLRRT